MILPFVEPNKILECVVGSTAYGFATKDSDIDIKGITIPPLNYLLGLDTFEQQQYPGIDKEIYSLKKFVNLAAQCNPNIIEIICMPEIHILHRDKYGVMLMENADLFISKAARHRFSGYAFAQLKRIKRHKAWIDGAPDRPNPMDYKYERHMILKEGEGGSWMPTKVDKYAYDRFEGEKWIEEGVAQEYEVAKKHFDDYNKWKRDRNPKRAELEEKFGYDTKHACHLVRLLRMGIEILSGDGVLVDRRFAGDAEELLEIRRGKLSYEELVAYADECDAKLQHLYETSDLRHTPDMKKINELYMNIVCERFGITIGKEESKED